jgi:hypothetical protein
VLTPDASPVFRVHWACVTATSACASASFARDRLVSPNQSATAKHYGPDPRFHRARPVRPHWLRRAGTPVPNVGGPPQPDASLEVFVPCNARRPRSRCPGRPASGRSRFGVSSSSGPRARAKRTCRRDERRPCGFSLQRTCCEDARVADPRPRTFQPNPSLARRPLGGRRRGRRVDGLLSCSWSQVCRSSARVRPVEPIRSCDPSAPLSRTIPSLSRSRTTRPLERLRYKSAARHGSFAIRAFFAWRSATRSRTKRGLVGRRRSSLVHRPTALLGFVPFAGLIPHPGGRVRRLAVSTLQRSRHFCRSGPTCRSCPLVRPD